MKLLHVAAAALNQMPLDWEGNKANILAAVAEARALGVGVLCLPELCVSGYGCEDAFLSTGVQQMALRVLGEIAPHCRGMIVAVGVPILHEDKLFNAACLLVDGKIAGFVAKQNLCGDGIHYEPRWFKPWPAGVQSQIEVDGTRYPLGDFLFECDGVRIGFEICEDAWVAERVGGRLAQRRADLILNPSASHFAFAKQEIRRGFVVEASRDFGVGYLYANLLGNEAGRAVYDGGTIVAAGGQILAEGHRFSFHDYHILPTVIDLEAIRKARPPQNLAEETAADTVNVPFTFPETQPTTTATALAAWEDGSSVKEEEFSRAVSLALFDYLRKSRSHGYVVSLSGGADSAAVAMLVALAIEFAANQLGREGLLTKLNYIGRLQGVDTNREIVGRLLTCVYQATRNSTEVTRSAACTVAEALGAEFLEFDVDSLVQQYIGMVSQGIGRELSWETDDLALQNIQARARAPGVWMLANLRGALLLATSNRSEAAVGYTTMDGDTCGGLSPVAGIDKAFLRHWLTWMESEGPTDGLHHVAALHAVNAQQPTAELRPPAAGQTDEDDLMPYDVLDAIERAAIRDKQVPREVLQTTEPQFPQYDRRQLGRWVERFFQLWSRNQWKRERYAPSFHLDDENLDPKTWCRFPILSGGFQRELAELRQELDSE